MTTQFQDRFIFLLSLLYLLNYLSAAQREAGQTWGRRLTDADLPASTAELLGKFCTVFPSNPEGFADCGSQVADGGLYTSFSQDSSLLLSPEQPPDPCLSGPHCPPSPFSPDRPAQHLVPAKRFGQPHSSSQTCTEPPSSRPHSSEQL